MADQLYLSYWLRGFTTHNMARHFEKMLRVFPYSRLARHPATVRVLAMDYALPPVFEQPLPNPIDVEAVLTTCREFQHADSAFRVETAWDLWQFDTDWEVKPARTALCCFGPEFEEDEHLRIEFGIDTYFLPQPGARDQARMVQSNVRSLLKLVHDLDDALAAERRKLWTDSGENFAEVMEEALRGTV